MFLLREATAADAADIARLVRALAEYERLADQCRGTADDFRRELFERTIPSAHALIAEREGRAVGLALWFFNFSTFTCRPGLYLEDLFVEPAQRGLGIGRAMLQWLARHAVAQGCARLEWSVLDWNEPALRFYRALGAEPMSDWTVQRLSGPALAALAGEG